MGRASALAGGLGRAGIVAAALTSEKPPKQLQRQAMDEKQPPPNSACSRFALLRRVIG
jgi:hypothetical protein